MAYGEKTSMATEGVYLIALGGIGVLFGIGALLRNKISGSKKVAFSASLACIIILASVDGAPSWFVGAAVGLVAGMAINYYKLLVQIENNQEHEARTTRVDPHSRT